MCITRRGRYGAGMATTTPSYAAYHTNLGGPTAAWIAANLTTVCSTCGALVLTTNQSAHTTFHANLQKMASSPALIALGITLV